MINKEIQIYQQVSSKLKFNNLKNYLEREYHETQQQVISFIDNSKTHNCYVMVNGRRWGKSILMGDLATGELLKPFSSILLLTPTYTNAKILFNNVMKNVKKLKLKVTSQNTNQFTFQLENGSSFTATSMKTVKNVLGSRISMLIVDETQDVEELIELYEQFIEPAMADYGVDENLIPYAKSIFIGTPRGIGTNFHELYIKEKFFDNWKSFNFPSSSNPLLDKGFLIQKKKSLPEYVYQTEYEAKWLNNSTNGVFFAFNSERNVFDLKDVSQFLNEHSVIIAGLDIGFQDSTAEVLIWVNEKGVFYILGEYQQNKLSTKEHVKNFLGLEQDFATPIVRYIDPSASQTSYDLVMDYNYITTPGKNSVMEGVACMNQLFEGIDGVPKMYVNKECTELIRQLSLVSWKDKLTKTLVKDQKKTHWDLAFGALRYAVYSYYLESTMGDIVML